MEPFEATTLFQETLGTPQGKKRPSPYADKRDRLRTAFFQFRNNVKSLSARIASDQPGFTVHDISHSDSLWETASLILGEAKTLNPLESFVLGGAFLIHDLGMALASYPNGIADLRTLPLWHDVAAQHFATLRNRRPSRTELTAFSAAYEAIIAQDVLRRLHAVQASQLLKTEYRDSERSRPYFLLEDQGLRDALGHTIGVVAYSHWWPISRLYGPELDRVGNFSNFPTEWVIDAKRIAALLRCADACAIDNQRAPGIEKALYRPRGISALHWGFQSKLAKPVPAESRIEFRSTEPFSPDESAEWWLAYDTVRYANKELLDANELLCSTGREPFARRGVLGCGTPEELSRRVQTTDWAPVDCTIRVSDAPGIVARLGGEMLYGQDPTVPLRELIQNSRDAIVARRIIENRDDSFGEVTISVRRGGTGATISVLDNGIGMSPSLLAGPLLDFGSSYWCSSLCLEEHPGLAGSGFVPNGQFGIGFFSVFMWGDQVSVVSRSASAAKGDTFVLEFRNGPWGRPILRRASPLEQLNDPGTLEPIS